MKLRKIRCAAVRQDDAAKASVIGFANRRVDANFGRDARDQKIVDAAVLELQFEIGLVERALAGLSITGSPGAG